MKTKRKSKKTPAALLCAGCGEPINPDDLAYELRAVTRSGKDYHRTCWTKASPEFPLMTQLFEMQDDPDDDPTTAMADLIGNLGHFATVRTGIDFAEAVRRGLTYWREER